MEFYFHFKHVPFLLLWISWLLISLAYLLTILWCFQNKQTNVTTELVTNNNNKMWNEVYDFFFLSFLSLRLLYICLSLKCIPSTKDVKCFVLFAFLFFKMITKRTSFPYVILTPTWYLAHVLVYFEVLGIILISFYLVLFRFSKRFIYFQFENLITRWEISFPASSWYLWG